MDIKFRPDGNLSELSVRGKEAVDRGGEIAKAHLKNQATLKIGLYLIATILVISSAFLVIFAPDGREGAATFIGVTMIIVGLGCAGFGAFSLKIPGVSLDAGTLENKTPNSGGDLPDIIIGDGPPYGGLMHGAPRHNNTTRRP